MYRAAVAICALAAVGLTVWGVVLALRGEPGSVDDAPGAVVDEPAFVIDNPDRDRGTVPLGPIDVVFDVTNPAGRPGRIIGFAEG
jgi:hypothetical protein